MGVHIAFLAVAVVVILLMRLRIVIVGSAVISWSIVSHAVIHVRSSSHLALVVLWVCSILFRLIVIHIVLRQVRRLVRRMHGWLKVSINVDTYIHIAWLAWLKGCCSLSYTASKGSKLIHTKVLECHSTSTLVIDGWHLWRTHHFCLVLLTFVFLISSVIVSSLIHLSIAVILMIIHLIALLLLVLVSWVVGRLILLIPLLSLFIGSEVIWIASFVTLIEVRQQLRILLDKSIVDFDTKFIRVPESFDIRSEFLNKLWEVWLLGDWEWLLDDVVAILIKQEVIEWFSLKDLFNHSLFDIWGVMLQAFFNDVWGELLHT